LGIEKVDGDGEENMLWHYYVWKETLLPGSTNTQLKRATADVLLYGPASLDQIQVQVVGKKQVKLEYTPSSVLYNSRRTALRTASSFSSHRIMCHDEAIQAMIAANDHQPITHTQFLEFNIDIDPNFTTRDDIGNEGAAQAIQIADYIHDNADFRKAGRTVTILHLELTAAERLPSMPSRAANYSDYTS
jgi:hypothetical protein